MGHENVQEVFNRLFISDRLSHAYLIVGPESVGKSTIIRDIASRLLEVPSAELTHHPDFMWVEREIDEKKETRKSNVGVKQIRNLRQRLSMSSFSGGYKVAVIEDAEFMNQAAANALLKILEEAPKKTVIFLRATSTDDLPKTITSRTQVFHLSLVSKDKIEKLLVSRGASKKEAKEIAEISNGRPGSALKLFEDRAALRQYRDDVDFLNSSMTSSVTSRMLLAKNLVPKNKLQNKEVGERILQSWEIVLRKKLVESVELGNIDQINQSLITLKKLSQSKKSFNNHTPLQLAFEHTLLHL